MKEFKQIGIRDGSASPLPKFNVTNEMHVADLDNCYCPSCGKGPLNGATGINAHCSKEECVPKAGSPTICTFCTELCIFREKNGKLLLDIASEREKEVWKADSGLWSVLKKVQKLVERRATERQLKGDKNYAKFKPKRY